jgi:hypothetical protein
MPPPTALLVGYNGANNIGAERSSRPTSPTCERSLVPTPA